MTNKKMVPDDISKKISKNDLACKSPAQLKQLFENRLENRLENGLEKTSNSTPIPVDSSNLSEAIKALTGTDPSQYNSLPLFQRVILLSTKNPENIKNYPIKVSQKAYKSLDSLIAPPFMEGFFERFDEFIVNPFPSNQMEKILYEHHKEIISLAGEFPEKAFFKIGGYNDYLLNAAFKLNRDLSQADEIFRENDCNINKVSGHLFTQVEGLDNAINKSYSELTNTRNKLLKKLSAVKQNNPNPAVERFIEGAIWYSQLDLLKNNIKPFKAKMQRFAELSKIDKIMGGAYLFFIPAVNRMLSAFEGNENQEIHTEISPICPCSKNFWTRDLELYKSILQNLEIEKPICLVEKIEPKPSNQIIEQIVESPKVIMAPKQNSYSKICKPSDEALRTSSMERLYRSIAKGFGKGINPELDQRAKEFAYQFADMERERIDYLSDLFHGLNLIFKTKNGKDMPSNEQIYSFFEDISYKIRTNGRTPLSEFENLYSTYCKKINSK